MAEKRKPISFDTTLRNPERIPQFLSLLSLYENKIMTDDVALELEAKIIIQKIYLPSESTLGTYFHTNDNEETSDKHFKKVNDYYNEWLESEVGEFDLSKMKYLLKNTMTKHKEAGWKYGWESRLATQYNILNELGLCFVKKNKEIKISENGKLMIKEYKDGHPKEDNINPNYELSSFLIAFSKYQTNNPFRKNTIKVNFFSLILNVISYLKINYNRPGISIQDIPFIITWTNNDFKELADYIYEFRQKYGYQNVSNELIYNYAMNLLDESSTEKLKEATKEFIELKKNAYKLRKILIETPDEVIRKLRLSMLISLRGSGRFIDLNNLENDKIEHIKDKYSENREFQDEIEYYEYMGAIDTALIFEDIQESQDLLDIKENVIQEWSENLEWNAIKKEMLSIAHNTATDNPILKYIGGPTRLEFLSAIAIKKALPNLRVIANYKADDNGIPFGHASGNSSNSVGSDIDVYENSVHATLEPTLSKSRSFQIEHELPSIRSHILESAKLDNEVGTYKEWFSIFIAPRIAKDVGNQVAVIKAINNVDIFPWEIEDFILYSQGVNSIKDYKLIRKYAQIEVLEGERL